MQGSIEDALISILPDFISPVCPPVSFVCTCLIGLEAGLCRDCAFAYEFRPEYWFKLGWNEPAVTPIEVRLRWIQLNEQSEMRWKKATLWKPHFVSASMFRPSTRFLVHCLRMLPSLRPTSTGE